MTNLSLVRAWWARAWWGSWRFIGRVYQKAGEDNIFFVAGAIAFNVIVAVLPFVLLVVGISGLVLQGLMTDPAEEVVRLLLSELPPTGDEIALAESVRGFVDGVLADAAEYILIGAPLFVWLATRLVGTLRTALREIFEVSGDRGIFRGKLFDARMVVVGSVLLVVNVGATVLLRTLGNEVVRDVLGLEGETLLLSQTLLGHSISFVSIWVLLLSVYHYLPLPRIPWRIALTAATFSAMLHEALKYLFSVYVTSIASFSTAYGNLATIVILFFWIYYGAVVFVLGGEVAQVYAMTRARRRRAKSAIYRDEG